MDTINLVPAYGRDYKSKAEVEAAYRKGLDFRIEDISQGMNNGRMCSIRDFGEGWLVTIRYDRLRKSHVFKV